MRLLVLCTHNSARSQMAEGWLRHYADELDVEAEVVSAGTERSFVKPEAIAVMHEVGIDLNGHSSKSLYDLDEPWAFDIVMTVCDSANESCPIYPDATTRLHVAFPDPSGQSLEIWREVRDGLEQTCYKLIQLLREGTAPMEAHLKIS